MHSTYTRGQCLLVEQAAELGKMVTESENCLPRSNVRKEWKKKTDTAQVFTSPDSASLVWVVAVWIFPID